MATNHMSVAILSIAFIAGCGSRADRTPVSEAKPAQTAKEVAHEFLLPYFADLETVAFVDFAGTGVEADGHSEVSGIAEGTLPAVWYLLENEYKVSCEKGDDGRWSVYSVELDGLTVFVAPSEARSFVAWRNALKTPRPLRAKPGAVEPK